MISFVIILLVQKLGTAEKKTPYHFLASLKIPDMFAVIMGLCALGLVLIPELVYVRDIYENGSARANTMFKIDIPGIYYVRYDDGLCDLPLYSRFPQKDSEGRRRNSAFLLICTWGYFGNSVSAWFGNVMDPSQYRGLNATAFLETDFPEDAAGIRWLKSHITGSPVVLEANGDSYTEYERVSAMTGLPTILGWYVHEWLWRNDVSDLNAKAADIEAIYTSDDEAQVRALLEEYDVAYIFVGSCERSKYGENLNNEMLKNMGQVVFQDEAYETYIVKVYS